MHSPFPSPGRSSKGATSSLTNPAEASASRPTVSIVDDDPQIRAMVADELTESGCVALSLISCDALHEALAAGPIDLVLLDVQMPDCDGIAFLRKLRSRGYTLPVIIFTSLNEPQKRREAQVAGANHYVLKHELLDRLPDLLQHLLPARHQNRIL
jgi:DNA-binding response OmpR family regulator